MFMPWLIRLMPIAKWSTLANKMESSYSHKCYVNLAGHHLGDEGKVKNLFLSGCQKIHNFFKQWQSPSFLTAYVMNF